MKISILENFEFWGTNMSGLSNSATNSIPFLEISLTVDVFRIEKLYYFLGNGFENHVQKE